MLKKTFLFLSLLACIYETASAHPGSYEMTGEEYIQKYKDDAVREMLRTGIPASITLAQGLLESQDGNSKLAREANNHFGIKCHEDWNGGTFYMDDDRKHECFRKYPDVYDSYQDHSEFLLTRDRYSNLFKLNRTNYKAWAHGLKKDGYATNPHYASLLIGIIQQYKLYRFDEVKVVDSRKMVAENESSETDEQQPIQIKKVVLRKYNGVEYTVALEGESIYDIASHFEIPVDQLLHYNDLNKDAQLKTGQVVYLQPKRRRAKVAKYVVKKGDTMWKISQLYAVKLKQLYKKNNMIAGTEPMVGQVLSLKKQVNNE